MAACVINMSTVVHCRLVRDLSVDQNSSTTLPIFELLLIRTLNCFQAGYASDTTAIHARLLPSAGICLGASVAAGFKPVPIRSGAAAAVRLDHRAVLHTCTGAVLMCQQFLRQPPVSFSNLCISM